MALRLYSVLCFSVRTLIPNSTESLQETLVFSFRSDRSLHRKTLEDVLHCWKEAERDGVFCPQIYITDSAQYSNTQLSQLGQLLDKGFSLVFVVFDMNEERDESLYMG